LEAPTLPTAPFLFWQSIKFDQLSILLPVTKSGRIQCRASGSQFGPPGLPPLVSHCGLSPLKDATFSAETI